MVSLDCGRLNRRWVILATAATCLVTGEAALADTYWKLAAVDQNWFNASNWNGGLPGTGNVDAFINLSTGNFPIVSSGTATVDRDVRIGTGSQAIPETTGIGMGRLDVTGGTLNTGDGSWLFLGYAGGTATLNLANTAGTGGTLTGFAIGSGNLNVGGTTQNGNLLIGLDNNTVSTLNVNTTGTLAAANIFVGSNGASVGTVNLDSGTVNVSGEIQIGASFFGNGNVGNLNVSGGMLTADIIHFARADNNVAQIKGNANITGGTLNSKRYFTLGFAGNANNVANVSNNGGTININTGGTGHMEMGVFDASVNTFNANSGAVSLHNNASILFGAGGNHSGTSTFNHNGGTVTFYSNVGMTVGGTGTVNLGSIGVAGNSPGTYVYNLNNTSNAVLTVLGVQKTSAAANGTFNFNGGTLRATANNPTFMQGLTAANVQAGGAVIDTNGFGVTIGQALADGGGGGGMTKTGLGTLTLSAANTYNGKTTVSQGTLTLATSGNINTSNEISIASGATLDVSAYSPGSYTYGNTVSGNGAITGNLTLSSGSTLSPGTSIGTLTETGNLVLSGTYLAEYDGAGAGSIDKAAINGSLNISAATVNFMSIGAPADDPAYIFASYTSLAGMFATVLNLPAGYTIDYNFGGNQIALVAAAVPEPLTAAGVLLLTSRVLGRRARASL